MTKAAQVGQHAHGAVGARKGARGTGVEVVAAAEADERAAASRPQPGGADPLGHRVEVEVGHDDAVAEAVLDGPQAAMPDPALVEGVHAGTRSRRRATARCALITPSSWKPQDQ